MEHCYIPKTLLSLPDIDIVIASLLKKHGKDSIFTFQITGNAWEPIARWLRMDSRVLRPVTQSNRLSTWDIESLAEMHGLFPVKWEATKLTPFPTKWLPDQVKNACRRLPVIRSFAYTIDYSFRNARSSLSDADSLLSKSISIVLPARNESGNEVLIREALDTMADRLPGSEIVFVEGNSSDNTWSMLSSVVNDYKNRLKVLLIKQDGKGKKNAVVCGFAHAKGNILAIIDTDFTVDVKDSIKAVEYSAQLGNCFINCTRTVYPIEEGAMRWANYIGNRIFAILLSSLLGQKVSDSLCGSKIFSRHLYELMLADGSWLSPADPFGDFTILFGASKYKYKVINFPVRYKSRFSGAPNISRWVDGLKLIRVCWHYLISS